MFYSCWVITLWPYKLSWSLYCRTVPLSTIFALVGGLLKTLLPILLFLLLTLFSTHNFQKLPSWWSTIFNILANSIGCHNWVVVLHPFHPVFIIPMGYPMFTVPVDDPMFNDRVDYISCHSRAMVLRVKALWGVAPIESYRHAMSPHRTC